MMARPPVAARLLATKQRLNDGMTLVSLARNPVPSGAVAGHLATPDGHNLRFARWEATQGPRRGTVCVFPGRSEFIEKYFEVVAEFRRRGFAVAVIDWRGQGGSSRLLENPLKGHIDDFSTYDRDLKQFMLDIVLPDCPPPYVALGHSMGAAILLRNAAKPGSWFSRMILTAPMIAFSRERVPEPQQLVRGYAEAACLLGFSESYVRGGGDRLPDLERFENNALTSDKDRWQRAVGVLSVAPQLRLGSPTNGWLRAATRAMTVLQARHYPARIEVPMMVFSAGGDRIVDSRAVEDFAVQLKVGSQILLPGSRHEILQESDPVRLRFWAAVDAYLGYARDAA